MTQAQETRKAAIRQAAVEWSLRVNSADATAEDWIALTDWLEASPEHLAAFEAVEQVASDLEGHSAEIIAGLARPRVTQPPRSPWRHPAWLIGGLAAASVALAAPVAWRLLMGAAVPYQTAKGETRQVVLRDGTRITLNSGSRLSARISPIGREVWMDEAEAGFEVAPDPHHPFLIKVGDQQIRVVGTEFNVRHYDHSTTVSVRKGIVEVSLDSGAVQRLSPGQSLRHVEGEADAQRRTVDPDTVFGWMTGQLICDDEPLSELISVLNHRYADPVTLGAGIEQRRFSGVLQLGDQAKTLDVLARYLSLRVEKTPAGFRLIPVSET